MLTRPSDFIYLAEETGLIRVIGQWVINEACRQLREWQDHNLTVVPVAINLSAREFHQPELVSMIEQALKRHEIRPHLLVIEVTESYLMVEETMFLDKLHRLKKLGVSIDIDDFGTGYSNMHSLKTMPVDALKIDRSFILGVEHDERDRAIYHAIVAMAEHLGVYIIAEGVETEGQYHFLKQIGCKEIQGYYFSPSIAAADFSARFLIGSQENLIADQNV